MNWIEKIFSKFAVDEKKIREEQDKLIDDAFSKIDSQMRRFEITPDVIKRLLGYHLKIDRNLITEPKFGNIIETHYIEVHGFWGHGPKVEEYTKAIYIWSAMVSGKQVFYDMLNKKCFFDLKQNECFLEYTEEADIPSTAIARYNETDLMYFQLSEVFPLKITCCKFINSHLDKEATECELVEAKKYFEELLADKTAKWAFDKKFFYYVLSEGYNCETLEYLSANLKAKAYDEIEQFLKEEITLSDKEILNIVKTLKL